ncbi:hypothetical protein ACEPPN_019208 [Leptodophora sp. 'Broadleaf-Isolate-01']
MASLKSLAGSLREKASKAKKAAASVIGRHDENQSYTYSSFIEGSKDAIRTFELQPGEEDMPLECSFNIVQLTERPTYEAISHTWRAVPNGKSTHRLESGWASDEAEKLKKSTSYIFCEGKRIAINDELRQALRGLRHPTNKRTLWVDQICIDQKNKLERDWQLLLVKYIYNRAARVILWIGEESSTTAKAFEIVEKLASVRRDFEIEGTEIVASATLEDQQEVTDDSVGEFIAARRNDLGPPSPETVAADHALGLPPRQDWRVLADIYRCPIFERIWILEEVCVARKVMVRCGSFETDWVKFANVATILQHGKWIEVYKEIAGYLDKPSKGGNQTLHTGLIKDMVSWRRVYHCELESTSWGALVGMVEGFNATDPRDKIFALFSMADGIKSTLTNAFRELNPTYADSVAEIYTKATRSILSHESTLDLLCRRYDRSFDKTPNLPSWVPDFVLRGTFKDNFGIPINTALKDSPYKAANDTKVQIFWLIVAGQTMLATPSYRVDTIAEVGLEWDPVHYGKVMLDWSSLVTRRIQDSYVTGERLSSAFWRTCVKNVSQSGEFPAPRSCGRLFSAYTWGTLRTEFPTDDLYDEQFVNTILVEMLMESFQNTWRDNELLESLDWIMTPATRRFFVTEGGYMGLCNKSVKAGDQVHVLSGGHVPFILRPVEAKGTGTSNCYSFMGDTYVHGIMNGEALAKKDFKWAEIHIQ